MSRNVKIVLGVLGVLILSSAVCCGGALVWGLAADEPSPTPVASARSGGASPGFSLQVPASFREVQPGRWRREGFDGTTRLAVDVQRYPPIPGLDGAEDKVAALWQQALGPTYEDVQRPLVLRRFVANGGRAHYASARLVNRADQKDYWLDLYLVEADDQLEPFLAIQSAQTDEMGAAMIIQFAWPKVYAYVDEFLRGVNGSPTGRPLVDDGELVGHFVYGDTNTAQWVNTVSGATSMTAVARAVEFTFADDGTYTYAFSGASGTVGALKFATEHDDGEWKVEHDVLVLTGKKHQYKYFLTGAPHGPGGQRLLLMQPEPRWVLGPSAEHEVYVAK